PASVELEGAEKLHLMLRPGPGWHQDGHQVGAVTDQEVTGPFVIAPGLVAPGVLRRYRRIPKQDAADPRLCRPVAAHHPVPIVDPVEQPLRPATLVRGTVDPD